MSFTFKDSLSLSIFGSSHGGYVGIALSGFPPGMPIDLKKIDLWMKRRAPGNSSLTSQRKESDEIEVLSGINNGYTDGGSIAISIKNRDVIGKGYDEILDKPRPGHGDLSLFYKYGRFRNSSGGGFLSGRMTAPLVAAGAMCMQAMEGIGVEIVSYIDSMGDITYDMDASVVV